MSFVEVKMNCLIWLAFVLGHIIGDLYATDCPSSQLDISINSTKILFSSPNFPADYPRGVKENFENFGRVWTYFVVCSTNSGDIVNFVMTVVACGHPASARPLSCKWLLTAGDNEVINFRILTFDVFPSIFCYRDVFDIFDGKLKYSAVLQSWCGGRPAGQQFQTSTQHSLVTFQAVTEGDTRQGFELEVWSELKHEPEMGKVELGPVNIALIALSASITFGFAIIVVVIVTKEVHESRKNNDDY